MKPPSDDSANVAVRHGAWGESLAVAHLRRRGFEILERNVHPYARDRRLEIDIVAWERQTRTLVFVEVKQHKSLSPYARRLQSVTREKRRNLRLACAAWRRIHRWEEAVRFDVVEIYGVPSGGEVLIDHIRDVQLFGERGRFVRWDGEE